MGGNLQDSFKQRNDAFDMVRLRYCNSGFLLAMPSLKRRLCVYHPLQQLKHADVLQWSRDAAWCMA